MSDTKLLVFLVVVVGIVCEEVAASLVSFSTSSPSLQPGLTPDLTLRCSLTDTPMTSSVTSPVTTTSGGLVGRRRRRRDVIGASAADSSSHTVPHPPSDVDLPDGETPSPSEATSLNPSRPDLAERSRSSYNNPDNDHYGVIDTIGSQQQFGDDGLLPQNVAAAVGKRRGAVKMATHTRRGAVQTVTQTDENVQFVMSIHVMRDGREHVASVSQNSAASALGQAVGDVTVTGSVSGDGGERGFLEVTWQHPTTAQLGSYTCEVSTLTVYSNVVVFSKTVNVTDSSATLADVIQYIHDLQLQSEEQLKNMTHQGDLIKQLQDNATKQEIKVTQQEKEIVQLQDKATKQENTISQHESTITQHESKISELENKNSQQDALIKENAHYENGTTWCGHSYIWDDDVSVSTEARGTQTFHTRSIKVAFSKSYPRPPLVYVALQDANFIDDGHDDWLRVDVLGVSFSSFTVRCGMYTGGGGNINDVRVRWLALPV